MLGDGKQPGEFGQIRVDLTRFLHHGLQRSLGRKGYFYFPFSAVLIFSKVYILIVLFMYQQIRKLYHLGVFSEYGGHWTGHDITVPEGGLQFPGSQEDGWNMIPACKLLFTRDYISILQCIENYTVAY
jgi:hypothetical protein